MRKPRASVSCLFCILVYAGSAIADAASATQTLEIPEDPGPRFDVSVRLGDVLHVLRLELHSLRSDAFRVRAFLPDGRTVQVAPPEPATYRGWVVGVPRTAVAASIRDGGLNARIVFADGASWTIESMSGGLHSVRSDPTVLPFDSIEGGVVLGAADPHEVSEDGAAGHSGQHRVEIAIDAAFPFYEAHGSTVPDTVAAAEAMLNDVDFMFARDLLITYSLTDIIVRTSRFYDPMRSWFIQFQSEWNQNQTHVPRDMAHLLTEGSTGGNTAVGVVCDIDEAYGWSSGGAEVMAHELAHQWNSGHCHDYFPCNLMCGIGGYCMATAPKARAVMAAFRDSVTCLDDVGGYSDPLPPYAELDPTYITRDDVAAGVTLNVDVLANDHDGNSDPLSIETFDAITRKGGTVTRSVGTGSGGSDELIYTPPAGVFAGDDLFSYTVGDGTGLEVEEEVEVRVAAPGLIGYWKLDEGMGNKPSDSSGGGRTGVNTSGTWTAGVYGSALRFSGSGGVTVPAFHRDLPEATIAAWIKRDGPQNPFAGIVVSREVDPIEDKILYRTVAGLSFGSSNELGYQWNDDPAASGFSSGLVVPDAQWAFVAVAVEADRATVYLHDGTTLRTAVNAIPHAVHHFGESITFAQDPMDPSMRFRGTIDDVRVYDYALDATEIAALHDLGGKAFAPDPADSGGTIPGYRELAWSPGLSALSHDVYFGNDYVSVRDATIGAPEYRGNRTATVFLAPPPVRTAETYFWRVDEVTAGGTVKGDVWTFFVDRSIAHWTLDDTGTTVVDEVGGFHGTCLGGPQIDQPPALPELGRSVFFDGVDDSIELPPLDLDRNEVTFTAWLKRDGDQDVSDGIMVTCTECTFAGLNFGPGNVLRYGWQGIGEFVLAGLSVGRFWDSGLVVPDAKWVFVALVIEPGKATVYLGEDGVLSGETNYIPNDREEFDGHLYLGADPVAGLFFRGGLDDVRIFDHALTPTELDRVFTAGTAAGLVPGGLSIDKAGEEDLSLAWSPSCRGADTDYAVYEGRIGDFTSHVAARCGTGGATSAVVTPQPGDRYFLIVPTSADREGSYGADGAGRPRPASTAPCLVPFVGSCEETILPQP